MQYENADHDADGHPAIKELFCKQKLEIFNKIVLI
jgi:hypothetical protein